MCATRIVLAEDDSELRLILSYWLGMRWDVEAVPNGLEALESIRANKPTMLVCDILMPKMDGLELVTALRGDPETADLPICMITASTQGSDTHDNVWKMASQANAFITKPFEPQELLAKVEELITESVRRRRGELK